MTQEETQGNTQSLTVVCCATLKRTSVTSVGGEVVPEDDTTKNPTDQKKTTLTLQTS